MAQPTCPNCGAQLFPHELKNGECTSCMAKLPANLTAEAAPEPGWRGGRAPDPYPDPVARRDAPRDFYDEPGGYAAPSPGEYSTFRAGVNMVRWGTGIILGLGALFQVVTIGMGAVEASGGAGGGRDMVQALGCMALVVGVVVLCCALIAFLGVCFCCAVPGTSRGAGWARGLIVCMVLVVVLALLTGAVFVAAKGGGMGRGDADAMLAFTLLVGGGLLLAGIGANVCFYMLLRGVALDFRDPGLAGGFVTYLIVSLLLGVLTVGVSVYVRFFFIPEAVNNALLGGGGIQDIQNLQMIVMTVSCGQTVVGLAMGIWMLVLLSKLYNLVGYGGGRGRNPYAYGGGVGRW